METLAQKGLHPNAQNLAKQRMIRKMCATGTPKQHRIGWRSLKLVTSPSARNPTR
eukprot:NODE_8869_length_1464_cov_2.808527.p7 GENE.NODE_8869_length_1464_cov_2.808527~~NODE_8869_length_1464_cov_2.808527.p7  ORF type:complete len:55 (+),score=0.41 NODE_8869_length_1464_cov_2.808527:263-427(+)